MERPVHISIIGPDPSIRGQVTRILSDSLRERGYRTVLLGSKRELSRAEAGADLIFLDNELTDEFLKIEIAPESPRARVDQTVFALIGSQKFRLGKPEFHSHEMDALTEFLIEQFLKTHLLE